MDPIDFSKEYSERFEWRRDYYVSNLKKLAQLAHPGGAALLSKLPGLASSHASDDPTDAIRWSILLLWLQASECYVFGQFEPCILGCGAVLERCLKLEYQVSNVSLPPDTWTLGKCIHKLDWNDTRITSEILELAKECVEPRNSRAHALLEHQDPRKSILGGDRGITMLSNARYLIEPYRTDADRLIKNTWQILLQLYGQDADSPNDRAA